MSAPLPIYGVELCNELLCISTYELNDDLKLKSAGLACCCRIGANTLDMLANALANLLKEFRIQSKVIGCITDSSTNLLKAFCLFGTRGEEFLGIEPEAEKNDDNNEEQKDNDE